MDDLFSRRLQQLRDTDPGLLQGGLIGLEKESLRVGLDGHIAKTPHPRPLSAALTHPYITTDYAEALLELITPPLPTPGAALGFLREIHQFVYSQLDDELLWAASMPCVVDGDASVNIAEYGHSNLGRFKNIYRRGLGHRYGRVMQVIAGLHFNFSLGDDFWPVYQDLQGASGATQDFRSACYFGLLRNIQRYDWLLLYLFGSSPAVCKSFLRNQPPHRLREYDSSTAYLPFATSLRMSDIGYSNRRRCGFTMRYDSLDSYAAGLRHAVSTICPPYQAIGVKSKIDGEYRQLNANILQIENEYYSVARPKQPPLPGERTLSALAGRGVAYVELRSNDIDLFNPLGVDEPQLRFLEIFLLFCLLHDSPPIDDDEQRRIAYNQAEVALRGRDPELGLQRGRETVGLRAWGLQLCEQLADIGELLDGGRADAIYGATLAALAATLRDPDMTPSARLLAAMRDSGLGFFHFTRQLSEQHRDALTGLPLAPERQRYWQQLTARSLAEQEALEAADDVSFDVYLERYMAALSA